MPDDDVQFKSPKTGKVQVVPPEQWEDALNRGYTPTTHKVMYSPDGKRGMVANGELTDYVKQGYQTTPKTQLEQGVTGEGISLKGAGTAAWNTLKGMAPPVPKAPVLSKEFWLGKPDQWSFDPSKGGIAQIGTEAATEYQRARAAGTNPIAAGYSAAISGAGPLAGISDIEQQKLAAQGEGGQIIGQSAVPLAAAALPFVAKSPLVEGAVNRLQSIAPPGAVKPGQAISAATHPKRALINWALNKAIGTGEVAPETAESFSKQQRSAAYEEMNKDFAKKTAAKVKADAAAAKATEKLAKNAPPPDPFAGMTSTAAPVGNAELPPATGAQAPFPAVTRKGGMASPPTPETPPSTGGPLDITQPKTSLLSRGRTVIQPGMEPDMSNPAHVKMINDYQTISGPKLRELAGAGDRFAAFVLRHMPRP